MDKAELLEIFTREQRIDVEFPDIQREVDGSVVRHISLSDEDGFIGYSRLDEDNVEAVISAQIARFESIPQDFEWKVYDYDTPSDLLERLRRRGFKVDEPEALAVLDLTTAPEALERPVPASVVKVSRPEEIDALVDLESAVWRTDHRDLGERLKRGLEEYPDMVSIYLSYEAGEVASAAWIYFHAGSRFASLWGGSTLPRFRNRGHYSLLLAARAQEARRRGFSLLTVDAGPMSLPILQRHGFLHLANSTACRWKNMGSSMPIPDDL